MGVIGVDDDSGFWSAVGAIGTSLGTATLATAGIVACTTVGAAGFVAGAVVDIGKTAITLSIAGAVNLVVADVTTYPNVSKFLQKGPAALANMALTTEFINRIILQPVTEHNIDSTAFAASDWAKKKDSEYVEVIKKEASKIYDTMFPTTAERATEEGAAARVATDTAAADDWAARADGPRRRPNAGAS